MGQDNFINAQSALYFEEHKFLSYLYLLKFLFFLKRNGIISLNQMSNKYFTGLAAISDYRKLKKEYE